jgi:chemotaxis methyl-accepting protein methylase
MQSETVNERLDRFERILEAMQRLLNMHGIVLLGHQEIIERITGQDSQQQVEQATAARAAVN